MNDINEQFLDAVRQNDLRSAKLLIKKGANINYSEDYALQIASKCRNLEIVKYLLDNGACASADNNLAIRWAYYSALEVGDADEWEISPLNLSSKKLESNRLKIIKLLINHGASLIALKLKDRELLDLAIALGNIE